ncbi:MAG: hypothetical protein QXJ22_05335, partial [Ignisphaera sp.]
VFGKALTKLQVIVGEYFSKFQGGIYCCREAEEIVRILLDAGVHGAGQSSWGPTVYGIVDGRDNATWILQKVVDRVQKLGIEFDYHLVNARRNGATIKTC